MWTGLPLAFLLLMSLSPKQILEREKPGTTPPRLMSSVDPVPPHRFFSMGRKHVVVLCMVNEAGEVADAKVTTSAGKKYDESALTAVRQYRFEPALRAGKPVAFWVYVDVTYEYRSR